MRFSTGMPLGALTVVCVTVIMACATTTRAPRAYPEGWPRIAADSSGNCAGISGTYKDGGAFTSNRFDHEPLVSLARFFWESARLDPRSSSVKLAQVDPQTWRVEVFRAGEESPRLSKDLTRIDCRCENGALWLQPMVVQGSEGNAGHPSQWQLGLRRSETGFLIGEERLSSLGYLFVVPVAGSQTLWYKWSPAGS